MLKHNIDYFRAKPVNIPKITLLLDHGYHPEHLTQELEQVYPQIMTKIKFVACFPKGTLDKTLKTRKGSTREIWICSGCSKMEFTLSAAEGIDALNPEIGK